MKFPYFTFVLAVAVGESSLNNGSVQRNKLKSSQETSKGW